MTAYLRGPLLHTWLLLSAATVLSWGLGLESAVIMLVAIIKCRFVIRTYMEVRLAPAWLQRTCDAWLILNFGMVVAAT
jgi:hypothetical protein